MNLINDLGTDLALAFLVEKRYRQKIDSEEALALIRQVRCLLEAELEGERREPMLSRREPFHQTSTH
jgi:hypothetical protein